MSLKGLIKAVLPAPVLSYAIACRQQALLAGVPAARFETERLRPANEFALDRILNAPDSLASWEQDGSAIASVHPALDLFGGVNPGDRRALYALIRALRPRRVLEVGTHIGSSTVHIAQALKTNGEGTLDTVDIYDVNDPVRGAWKTCGATMSPRAMLEQLGAADRVTFHATGAMEFFRKGGEPYDLIFLDGDHSATAVYNEVAASLPRLAPGGIIVLHDYYPDGKALFPQDTVIYGPYLGMRRVLSETKGLKVIPMGDLPWPTKQGVTTTSLAVVVRT